MACKGICTRDIYAATRGTNGYYIQDHKRCQTCERFLNVRGLWCPCCGLRLRTKPRNMKYKAKLKRDQKKQQILNDKVTTKISKHMTTVVQQAPMITKVK